MSTLGSFPYRGTEVQRVEVGVRSTGCSAALAVGEGQDRQAQSCPPTHSQAVGLGLCGTGLLLPHHLVLRFSEWCPGIVIGGSSCEGH